MAVRSRSSWGRPASAGVSQRAVPILPEASKASSTTYRPVGAVDLQAAGSLPWPAGRAVTCAPAQQVLVPPG